MRFFLPVLFLLVAALSGCSSTRALQEQAAQFEAERDSLRRVIGSRETLIQVYRDSLQFYDDIDSGQYERNIQRLEDRILQLEFRSGETAGPGEPIETLRADELFEPASATLSASGRALLDRVAQGLKGRSEEARFTVEGHADSSPVGPTLRERFPSNWELAAARAAAVTRHLIATGLAESRFEVVSQGSNDPVASNDTAEGRARNRRIVIYAR